MQLRRMDRIAKSPTRGDENTRLLVLSRKEAIKITRELIAALAQEPGGGYDSHMVTDDDGNGLFHLIVLLDQKSTWEH